MFVIKVIYVYLCFQSVRCIYDDSLSLSSDSEAHEYDSFENKMFINKPEDKVHENGKFIY